MSQQDVLQLAYKHLDRVKRSGPDNIMAVCPFHRKAGGGEERTPSFTMSLTKGLYYCFSCHESGNLFTFLRNLGVDRRLIDTQYKSLLEDVRSRAGTKPKPFRVDPNQVNAPLPEALLGIFDKCPVGLLQEGFPEDLLQKLDIGFDDAHMRITYPLRDLEGTLVGISGRTVTDTSPRYKVYDVEFKDWELPIHKTFKSHLLWNGHRVYPSIYFERKPVVVVEGFKACMRVLQADVPNVVGIMGSKISDQQKWQLERMASEVWVFLDNNAAGLLGTVIAGETIGLPVRVVPYPDEREQPSDLTVEELQLALSTPIDFHRWLLANPPAMEIRRARRSKRQKYDQ